MKLTDLTPKAQEFLRQVWEERAGLAPNQDLYGFIWNDYLVPMRNMQKPVIGDDDQTRMVYNHELAAKTRTLRTNIDGLFVIIGPKGRAKPQDHPGGVFPQTYVGKGLRFAVPSDIEIARIA